MKFSILSRVFSPIDYINSGCMKFFAVFSFLICNFNPIHAAPFQSIALNMQKECEIAVEVSRKFQRGMLSKDQANEILISTLSDYSHVNGKFATIAQFITKTAGLKNNILHASSEQRGWSGNEVYSIRTEEAEEIQFFLKVFPYDSKHYLPEIFGLAFLREIKEVGSPIIYACGQCLINENRYFLVLETPVKGISIQQYFIQVGQYQVDSKERSDAFAELCEAVQAVGLGLARFHHCLPNKKLPFPKDAEETMRQDLSNAIEVLTDQPKEGIEIEKLRAYTEFVLQKVKADDHFVGLAYDDIKTVHTFYDHKRKKFSLVNPDRLSLSFDHEGEVQGLPTKDICKFILSLVLNRFQYYLTESQRVCCKELLTDEEVKILIDSFESGYVTGGGILPSSVEKEYVFLQHDLFFIKNSRRNLPEPELTRVKDLVNISLDNIKSQLIQMN